MGKTRIRISFKSKNQAPLFMIVREYYNDGMVFYAEVLFEVWGYKASKQFGVNVFGIPKLSNSCLDGLLTHECQNCQYWSVGDAIGCCCNFPIMECKAFAKRSKHRDKIDKIKSMFRKFFYKS